MTIQILVPVVPNGTASGPVLGDKDIGRRVNGKNWHDSKKPFRPTTGLSSYELRMAKKQALEVVKAKEQELREEKQTKRDSWVQGIKDRREKKAEKERYEMLAQKMHRKRLDRLKRREKRNKMIKS